MVSYASHHQSAWREDGGLSWASEMKVQTLTAKGARAGMREQRVNREVRVGGGSFGVEFHVGKARGETESKEW